MTVQIPTEYRGLKEALNLGCPVGHFIEKAIKHDKAFNRSFVATLDARYRVVFLSDRLEWQGNRLQKMRAELIRGFESRDAEVQAAATILSHDNTKIVAQDDGQVGSARTADFLVTAPRL